MLRDYQERGEIAIYEAWQTYRRIMYQLPTGGGKTVNVTNIARKTLTEGKRIIFIAHREELITQAWQTFYKHKINAGIIKADVKPNFALPAQIGSIQTMARRKKLPPADVIVIDEGHHAIDDNSYGTLIKEHYPDAFVLSVTATPYRLNGRGFRKIFEHLVTTVQVKDLIEEGYLTPIRYFVCFDPDMTEVHKSAGGDFNIEEAAFAVRNAPIIKSYMDHARGKSGMVFAVNVDHSMRIVEDYRTAGISAAHIDANTPDPVRRRLIQDFREKKILVLSNVGIATEGFDVPNMDFVQLARPTLSLSLYLQMCGRCERVDNEVIKGMISAEQRRLAIATSQKPHCIILDNAGLYREHGMPDDDHNWHVHFNGTTKNKKKLPEAEIEIEYIVEDENGQRMRVGSPKEVEGLKLIEIAKSIKKSAYDMRDIEKEYADAERLAKYLKDPKTGELRVKKLGFFIFEKVISYCRKKEIVIDDAIWDMLKMRLYQEPQNRRNAEMQLYNNVIDAMRLQIDDPERLKKMENIATEFIDKKIAQIKATQLPEDYITKEKKEYTERLKAQTTT